MNLAPGADRIYQSRLNGYKPDGVTITVDCNTMMEGPYIRWQQGKDWRVLVDLDVMVAAKSLNDAAPAICAATPHAKRVDVFIDDEKTGYWTSLKLTDKPINELTRIELAREVRKIKQPTATDIALQPWPHWMYRNLHMGEFSAWK